MNTDNINIPEEDFNEGLEDIEQLLKPQCEFKASDTLKEEVLAQAREEVKPQRKVNLWPWVAAACSMPIWSVLIMQSISWRYLTRWMHANPSKTSNGD